jgi:hypothetical protein
MLETFLRYILPTLVSAGVGLIVLWFTLHAQTRQEAREAATKLAQTVKTDATALAVVTKEEATALAISARDDAVALRESLMEERKQLVDEINALQDRCDLLEKENLRKCPLKELEDLQGRCEALEKTNREQGAELLTLKEQNSQLIHEIKNFGSGLAEIKGVS